MSDTRSTIPDHYGALGVKPGASNAEVQRAWRDVVKLWHPDTNPSPDAAERMKRINMVRDVLLDPAPAERITTGCWQRVKSGIVVCCVNVMVATTRSSDRLTLRNASVVRYCQTIGESGFRRLWNQMNQVWPKHCRPSPTQI